MNGGEFCPQPVEFPNQIPFYTLFPRKSVDNEFRRAALRVSPAFIASRLRAPWIRKAGPNLRLAACFLSIIFVSEIIPGIEDWKPDNNLLWVANGLFLAYMLLAPRWRWRAYLLTGFFALSIRILIMPALWDRILLYNLLDMIEVVPAAFLLRRRSTVLPRFTDRDYLVRFIAFGVLAGPILAGVVFALLLPFTRLPAPVHPFLNWAAADSLGIAISTPAFVAVFRTRLRSTADWRHGWFYPVLLLAVAFAAFAQNTVPLVYLIYPLLVLVLVRLGLGYASLFTLFVAAIAGWLTIHGSGPFANRDSSQPTQPALHLQLAIASAIFLIYAVSVVLESRRSIEHRLEKIAALHQLVTENSRDLIMLKDRHGDRTYVSAAIQSLLGWTPEEYKNLKTPDLDLLHPEDRAKGDEIVRQLSAGLEVPTVEWRLMHRNGGYIWVEASLRMVRDPQTHSPTGILNLVRDIAERKRSEESRAFQHSVIRAIYEVSLEGILVVDNESNVVSYNKRFTDLWKIAATDIPAAMHKDGAHLPDDRLLPAVASRVMYPEPFLKRVLELYADPDATDQCEIQLKDGRTLERYSTSVRSDDGQYLGRVWFFRDISRRKIAEEKLQDAYTAVEALAATDALTGLANRRRFDQVLTGEWRRGLRDGRPLSLLMIDADLFKSYNDNYGHPQGDSCLKQIAEVATNVAARPGDLVARFGGEEFAAILPNTDAAGALQLGRAICEAMRARILPHCSNPSGIVTVSVGCATMVPAFEMDAVNLIELADEALYKAKHQGRNRVCDGTSLEAGRRELYGPEFFSDTTGKPA
jgi:diguanylate cyclase (GGDEF)-like protein/PAS domain S-box-containing protein